jgi:hypothetical protein
MPGGQLPVTLTNPAAGRRADMLAAAEPLRGPEEGT